MPPHRSLSQARNVLHRLDIPRHPPYALNFYLLYTKFLHFVEAMLNANDYATINANFCVFILRNKIASFIASTSLSKMLSVPFATDHQPPATNNIKHSLSIAGCGLWVKRKSASVKRPYSSTVAQKPRMCIFTDQSSSSSPPPGHRKIIGLFDDGKNPQKAACLVIFFTFVPILYPHYNCTEKKVKPWE